MADLEQDPDARNRALIEALRESFTPLNERLTPDVEPAVIYVPAVSSPGEPQ